MKKLILLLIGFCALCNLSTGAQSREKNPVSEDEIKRWPLPHQAAYRAAQFIETLPNFIVTEMITRAERSPDNKDWQTKDKLEVELTYSHKTSEKARLLKINDRPTTQTLASVFGATSQGEFGGFIGSLLDPRSRADFREAGKEHYRGRNTALYRFAVKKQNSSYVLTDKTTNRKIITGTQGTVWIDIETAYILRLEIAVTEVEPNFPLTMSEHAVEYDWVTIAGAKYFMPISAEAIIGSEQTRFYQRNVTAFKNYRLFDTGVKIIEDKEPPK